VCDKSGQRPILHFRSKQPETSHPRRADASATDFSGAEKIGQHAELGAPTSKNSLGYVASGQPPQSRARRTSSRMTENPRVRRTRPVAGRPSTPRRRTFFWMTLSVRQMSLPTPLDRRGTRKLGGRQVDMRILGKPQDERLMGELKPVHLVPYRLPHVFDQTHELSRTGG
jgi:hypothetical protein